MYGKYAIKSQRNETSHESSPPTKEGGQRLRKMTTSPPVSAGVVAVGGELKIDGTTTFAYNNATTVGGENTQRAAFIAQKSIRRLYLCLNNIVLQIAAETRH